MKNKVIDISKTLSNYSNTWLALHPLSFEVIAEGKSPKIVVDKANKKGVVNPVITRAPANYGTYVL